MFFFAVTAKVSSDSESAHTRWPMCHYKPLQLSADLVTSQLLHFAQYLAWRTLIKRKLCQQMIRFLRFIHWQAFSELPFRPKGLYSIHKQCLAASSLRMRILPLGSPRDLYGRTMVEFLLPLLIIFYSKVANLLEVNLKLTLVCLLFLFISRNYSGNCQRNWFTKGFYQIRSDTFRYLLQLSIRHAAQQLFDSWIRASNLYTCVNCI